MHSPYEAVYGFDRTHILRMTIQDYLNEGDVSNTAVASQKCKGGGRLLRSRDPNVQFCSKYPVYDQAGRELCVLYQILEAEVQQELCRVKQGGDVVRRSGVCLGAGEPLGGGYSTGAGRPPQRRDVEVSHHSPLGACMTSRGNKEQLSENINDNDNSIDVSASSRQFSSVAVLSTNYTDTGMRDVRGSSFLIYRDSGIDVCTKLLGSGNVDGRQQQQQQQRSHMVPGRCGYALTSQRALCDDATTYTRYSLGVGFGLPPQRSNTVSPKRFADSGINHKHWNDGVCGCDGVNEKKKETVATARAGGGEEEESRKFCATRTTFDPTARTDPLRFTTVRASELRATKELFAPGCARGVARRTINYSNPISCQAYGQHSKVISASLVVQLIAANLEAASSGGHFRDVDELMPQLQPCTVVTLGGERQCRISRYFASSDVYEAYDGEVTEPGDTAQMLIYRWSVRAVQEGLNEAHRAALGLSFASPFVEVAGYRYRDGGITVITMPRGYEAVPLSTIPLSARSFPTCIKFLLRMLSDLVVKRTVHGNLRGLNQIFLALRGWTASSDMPAALLVPVHWERLVDFSMFVDRNVGRTIPIEYYDISGRNCERVYYGQDVLMVVSMLLENELSGQLQPEQLAEAQRLLTMATEPTQVANYLIQLKNTMTVIFSDMAALQQEYEVALRCQC